MGIREGLLGFVSNGAERVAVSRSRFEQQMTQDLSGGVPENAGYLAVRGCLVVAAATFDRIEELLTPERELNSLYDRQDARAWIEVQS